MDQQLSDLAEPAYVSCMFCTARCFKLHGATSQGDGCAAAASTSSREMVLLQPGVPKPERSSTGRKHRAPFFVKTVKITTVRRKNCELHLPAFFFKDYGDRFQKFVLLQGPSGQVWPVNLCVSCGSTTGRPTVRFSRGWKEFANDHRLELGDKLIFTLASFSRFSVQVFDPLGRKKPTSSTAVSGWSFRREEDDDKLDELPSRPQQKKSIFVNWQNKVVRESSLGSTSTAGKAGQASRVAMICRHLKRDNKTRSSSLVAKLRSPSTLPLTLLGQKWSNAASDEDVLDIDAANNLLEWEPLETASPSQLWPLALKSSHSSKGTTNVLSITSNPASSPPREEGDQELEGDREEDPFQAYWKLHNKRAAISEVAAAETQPVRRMSTLELAPKAIDTPPSPALMSISHCLKPLSRPDAVPQPSQELLRFANSSSVGPEILSQRYRISDDAEKKIIPSDVQSRVSQALLGFASRESVGSDLKLAQRIRDVSEAEKSIQDCNVRSCVTQEHSSSKQASVRTEKLLPQRNQLEEAAEIIVGIAPSKMKTPTPSRSDLSLAYFLHQPRPTAQIQRTVHEDGQHSDDLSRPQRPPPVSSQKSRAPDSVRIKPQVMQCPSKENIPPGYNSSVRERLPPCKRSGHTSMHQLPQDSKKSRVALGVLSQGGPSRRDNFHLDSSSSKINSRVDDHLKMRKADMDLGAGALGVLGRASTKVGSGNRCDLVELDDIPSDSDDGSDDF